MRKKSKSVAIGDGLTSGRHSPVLMIMLAFSLQACRSPKQDAASSNSTKGVANTIPAAPQQTRVTDVPVVRFLRFVETDMSEVPGSLVGFHAASYGQGYLAAEVLVENRTSSSWNMLDSGRGCLAFKVDQMTGADWVSVQLGYCGNAMKPCTLLPGQTRTTTLPLPGIYVAIRIGVTMRQPTECDWKTVWTESIPSDIPTK